jgi:hypothetical protein
LQILYRTNDNFDNATAAVLTLLIPHNADYPKVLSYQVAQDSAYANCAPSYAFQLKAATGGLLGTILSQAELLLMQAALEKGWIVISPDHEGPGAACLANKQTVGGLIPAGVLGIANQYPEVATLLENEIRPEYKAAFDSAANQCFTANILQFAFKDVIGMFRDPTILYRDQAKGILDENAYIVPVPVRGGPTTTSFTNGQNHRMFMPLFPTGQRNSGPGSAWTEDYTIDRIVESIDTDSESSRSVAPEEASKIAPPAERGQSSKPPHKGVKNAATTQGGTTAPAPRAQGDKCANCKRTELRVADCLWASRTDGTIHGCPIHNSGSHSADGCQVFRNLDPGRGTRDK